MIDPRPAVHRFPLGDEIGLAANGGTGDEGCGGLAVSLGGVIDVNDIDKVGTVADAAELPCTAARDQSGNEVAVA